MKEQSAKSIRVTVTDDNGFRWHVDCERVVLTTLKGDEVLVKDANEVTSGE